MRKKMLWRPIALAYIVFFIGRATEVKSLYDISFNKGQIVLIITVGIAIFLGYKAGQEKKDDTKYLY